MKRRILLALILMGFTSLMVQALLIREFLISFYGNELTIGLILACWIISEAAGSGFASRFAQKIKSAPPFYCLLQGLIAIYLPISIFLIRDIKNVLTVTPGEAAGIMPILASSLVIIGPLSIFDGMQFPFGCKMYNENSKNSEQAPGRVYILEAVGFILAGPVLTYVFLTRLNSFQIAFLLGLINLISALSLMPPYVILSPAKRGEGSFKILQPRQGRGFRMTNHWYFGVIILMFTLLNLYVLFSNTPSKLHNYSIARQWKNQNVIEYKNSIYGNLAVIQRAEQYTFYSDGLPIINIPKPDIMQVEEFVHFGMLSHPDPKNILFLSGAAGGFINEALKYPVKTIDYAELDPLLINLLKKFPKEITQKELEDPRVNLKITDGVRFVKSTGQKYDIVFINLPSPSTLQLNRCYTEEFFGQIQNILSKDGRLILELPGSLQYLNKELRDLNLCVLTTLKKTFPYISVVPGDNNVYIASMMPFETSPHIFIRRLSENNVKTTILTQSYLEYRLKKDHRDWFFQELKKTPLIKENKNLTPSGVFYSVAYWNSLFTPKLRGFFEKIARLKFSYVIFAVITLFIIIAIQRRGRGPRPTAVGAVLSPRKRGTARFAIPASIATTGFVGMSLDLIFILSYQLFFGYVYHHIALLVTAFMAGLTFGGWIVTRNLARIRQGLLMFLGMEISTVIFCLGLAVFLSYLNNVRTFGFYPVFYILSALSGLLVGAEFPLANKMRPLQKSFSGGSHPFASLRAESEESVEGGRRRILAESAGILYAMDLLGAFFAALLVSIIFLPLFGVLKTCVFLAVLKLAGLILYLFFSPSPD